MTRLDIDPRFAAAHYQDGRDLHGAQNRGDSTSGDLRPKQPSVHSSAGDLHPSQPVRTGEEVAPVEQFTTTIYEATLKTRRKIDATIPRERQGWWADVCPGRRLTLRNATASDLARCSLRDDASRNPDDYLCELPADGALVSREAIEYLHAVVVPVFVRRAPEDPKANAAMLRTKVAYYMHGRDQAAEFARHAGHPELASSIAANWAAPGWLPDLCASCGGSGDREVFVQSGGSMPWNAGDGHDETVSCPECKGTGFARASLGGVSVPPEVAGQRPSQDHPESCGSTQPAAVPAYQPMTDEDIESTAHRMATRYIHGSSNPHDSSKASYAFNRTTLLDFVRAVLARVAAAPDLHAAIMNLQPPKSTADFSTWSEARAYGEGHRDARHGAADLVAAAPAAAPVATLHDDGYYTFKPGMEPKDARYAGWRMDVYAAPAAVQSKPIMTLAEFCAEGERLGVTAASLAEALSKRPEFADCLPAAVQPVAQRQPSVHQVAGSGLPSQAVRTGAEVAPLVMGCACKWHGDEYVERCDFHDAWHTALHEWADRAKTAEARLRAAPALLDQLKDEALIIFEHCSQETRDAIEWYDAALRVEVASTEASSGARKQDEHEPGVAAMNARPAGEQP